MKFQLLINIKCQKIKIYLALNLLDIVFIVEPAITCNTIMQVLVGCLSTFTIGTLSYCSSLDKQRICINTQLKSSRIAIKIKYVHTEKLFCRMVCNYAYHLVSLWVISKCQSGIVVVFLLVSAQYNSIFMNKISTPSQVFHEIKL